MENHGLFERYLDGSLSEIEKSDFLKKISEDDIFKKEFSLYNEVNNVIFNSEKRNNFKKAVYEAESRYFNAIGYEKTSKVKSTKKQKMFFYKIAASFAILVTLSVFGYYLFFSKLPKKELYALYYKPLSIDVISRSIDDSLMNIDKGFIAYQSGKFEESIKLLSTETNKDNVMINLVKGLSYLELKNFKLAETFLLKASSDETNGMHDDCLWYLSLTYIQLEKPKQAVPILQKLIDNNSVYFERAKELLKEIN